MHLQIILPHPTDNVDSRRYITTVTILTQDPFPHSKLNITNPENRGADASRKMFASTIFQLNLADVKTL